MKIAGKHNLDKSAFILLGHRVKLSCFVRSGPSELGSTAGEAGTVRGGRVGIQKMLSSERDRSQGPQDAREHQDIRTSTPGQTVCRPGPPSRRSRHVPGGCGQDARTLSATGNWPWLMEPRGSLPHSQ